MAINVSYIKIIYPKELPFAIPTSPI